MLCHGSSYPKLLVLGERLLPSGQFLTSVSNDPHLYFQFLWTDSRDSTFDWENSLPLYAFGIEAWRDNTSLLQLLIMESLFTGVVDNASFFYPGSKKRMVYTRDSFLRPKSSLCYDQDFCTRPTNQSGTEEKSEESPSVLLPLEAVIGYHCQNHLPIDVKKHTDYADDNDNTVVDFLKDIGIRNDVINQTEAANRRMAKKEKEALELVRVMNNFLQQRPFRC